jgi:hypothetical protein
LSWPPSPGLMNRDEYGSPLTCGGQSLTSGDR